MLKLTAQIESFRPAGYIAFINDNSKFKGMIVQANSPSEAIDELVTSLKVKLAYDYGIDVLPTTEKISDFEFYGNEDECVLKKEVYLNIKF